MIFKPKKSITSHVSSTNLLPKIRIIKCYQVVLSKPIYSSFRFNRDYKLKRLIVCPMLHGIFHRNFRFHGGENLDFRGWHILVLPEEKRGSTTARADGLLNNPSITPHYLSQRAGTEPITSPTNELISSTTHLATPFV